MLQWPQNHKNVDSVFVFKFNLHASCDLCLSYYLECCLLINHAGSRSSRDTLTSSCIIMWITRPVIQPVDERFAFVL